MARYDHTITTVVPAAIYDIACAIARAFDPDAGGADSYGCREQGDPPGVPEFYRCDTLCTAEFYEQVPVLLANPAMLHAAVLADYAARWPDLTPPTMDDCISFCAGVVTSTATAVDEGGLLSIDYI